MILSMTGFGDAVLEEGAFRYHLEIRSVNNRFFKASTRLSEQFAFLESEVEKHLRKRITRGSVTVHCHVRSLSAAAASELNTAAIGHYLSQLESLAQGERITIDLASLTTLPGVCQPRELTEREREEAWRIISQLLNTALDSLIGMRREEGRALAADLKKHCDAIRIAVDAIRERVPLVVKEYQTRLHARVQELINDRGVKLAEEDLIKEIGIFAERSDISEELSRLTSHLDQFSECMAGGEPAGRKLDFIAQELLRETNTIGSKAGDAQIARHIVEMKGSIDRLKEQVQNAE